MDFIEETREIFTGGFYRENERDIYRLDFKEKTREIFECGFHKENCRYIYTWIL